MLRNVENKIKKFFLLAPQTLAADALSAAADLSGVGNFAFEVAVGAAAFGPVDKMALKVTHSDDNITFIDVLAADLYSSVSGNIAKELVVAGDQNQTHLVEYRGIKRYVKIALDIQGALTGVPVAVTGLSTFVEIM
jgi:hypothetical protein